MILVPTVPRRNESDGQRRFHLVSRLAASEQRGRERLALDFGFAGKAGGLGGRGEREEGARGDEAETEANAHGVGRRAASRPLMTTVAPSAR